MPETMSIERRKLVKALGAELILTPGEKGMQGAIDKAKQLAVQDAKYFIPSQFDNPDNPLAHYRTTGPEIYRDMDGKIDFFIATVGTGGTLCGSARYLKEQAPHVQVIAVEPSASAVLEGGKPGPHGIQGIGAGFIPGNYDASLVDKVIGVDDEAAMAYARRAAKEEGLLVGISSGAALAAAVEVSNAHPRSRIAVILPDSGERYLSTALFS
jgi:cysteine synthase A